MSKRLIASEEVNGWLKANADSEDCDLCYMIKDLKQAVLDVAMLQVFIEEPEDAKTLQTVRYASVFTRCAI